MTSELSTSSGNVGSLSERTEDLEKQVLLEQEECKKRDAELKVNSVLFNKIFQRKIMFVKIVGLTERCCSVFV